MAVKDFLRDLFNKKDDEVVTQPVVKAPSIQQRVQQFSNDFKQGLKDAYTTKSISVLDTIPMPQVQAIKPVLKLAKFDPKVSPENVVKFPVDVARQYPRVGARLELTGQELAGGTGTLKPTTKIQKALLGQEDVTSIQSGIKKNKNWLEKVGVGPTAATILGAGGTLASTALDLGDVLDLGSISATKKLGKEAIEKLSKEFGEDAIQKLFRGELDDATKVAMTQFVKNLPEFAEKKATKEVVEDIAPSVLQVIDHKTGEQSYKTIKAADLEDFKKIVDGGDDTGGFAGKFIGDKSYHLTAKTPEQMEKVGFKNIGEATVEEVNKLKSLADGVVEDGEVLFHGTSKKSFDNINKNGFVVTKGGMNRGGGISLTDDPEVSDIFGKNGGVVEVILSKDARLLDSEDFMDLKNAIGEKEGWEGASQKAMEYFKNQGYDGVDYRKGSSVIPSDALPSEVRIWNPDVIKIRKKAADIVEDATKPMLKTFDDVVSALLKETPVNKIDLTTDAAGKFVDLTKVLNKFDIAPDLLKRLDAGEVIDGSEYILQKQGNRILARIDNTFQTEPIKEIVKDVATKTNKLKLPEVKQELPPTIKLEKTPEEINYLNQIKQMNRVDTKMQNQTTEDILKESLNKPLAETSNEEINFWSTAKKAAEESGNLEILNRAREAQQDMEVTLTKFTDTLDENKAWIDKAWLNFLNKTGDITGAKKVIDEARSFVRNFVTGIGKTSLPEGVETRITKYKFTDEVVDEYAKQLAMAKMSFIEQPKLLYADAKKEAEKILGRKINQLEYNALLRGSYEKEFNYAQKGAISRSTLGEDIIPKVNELQNVFSDVHAEIGGLVLSYEKTLNDLVRTGFLDVDEAAKYRLTSPEDFGKNLSTYVKTVYDKVAWDFDEVRLYPDAVREVGLNLGSAKRKLSDAEWGQAYLKALRNQVPDSVSKVQYIPEDLLQAVEAGEEGAITALGRRVKEMRGYVDEADKALQSTLYTLSNNWHDLLLVQSIAGREDLVSTAFREGFSKFEADLPGLKGKWIRQDVAEELLRDIQIIKDQTDATWNAFKAWGALWRGSKVVLNPSSWLTNSISGMTVMQSAAGNSMLNPANAKYYAKGFSEFWTQVPTGNITSKELREFISNGGIPGTFADSEIVNELAQAHAASADPVDFFSKVFQLTDRFSEDTKKLGEIYSYLDASNKYVTVLNKMDKGYDSVEALRIANKYHLFYLTAPDILQKFKSGPGNFLAPFATFGYLYGKMIAETMVEKPWRLIPWITLPAILNIGWKATHPELADKSEQQKPYWAKDNSYLVTLSYDKENDEFVYLDMAKYINIPTNPKDALNLFAGSIIDSGGPLEGIRGAMSGIDRYGNELDQPGGTTSTKYLLENSSLIPPIVFRGTELVDTMRGKSISSSGRVREPIDRLLKIAGINLVRGSSNQLAINIYQIKDEFQKYQNYARGILTDPRSSEQQKLMAERELQARAEKMANEITALVEQDTDAQGPTADEVVGKIVRSIMGEALPVGADNTMSGDANESIMQLMGRDQSEFKGPTINGVPSAKYSASSKVKMPRVKFKVSPVKLSLPKVSSTQNTFTNKIVEPITPPKVRLR